MQTLAPPSPNTTQEPDIRSVVDALHYNEASKAIYQTIWQRYKAITQERFQKLRTDLEAENPTLNQALGQRLEALGAPGMHPSIYHPEQLFRLLFHSRRMAAKTGAFMCQALDTELARIQERYNPDQGPYLWSSNGDFFIQHDADTGEFMKYEAFKVFNQVPIDFFSPHVHRLTVKEMNFEEGTEVPCYSFEEGSRLFESFAQCAEVVEGQGTSIEDFVSTFTNVINIKKAIRGNDNHLVSSTFEDFPGRTMIFNVEVLEEPGELMEIMVHETIHNMLFMLEDRSPWMPTEERSRELGNVCASNWTGRKISIRRYIHALVVWYGLHNLWQLFLDKGWYSEAFAVKRLAFIRKGYATVDLPAMASQLGEPLKESVFEAVAAMKQAVAKAQVA